MKRSYSNLTKTQLASLAISTIIVFMILGQMPVRPLPANAIGAAPAPGLTMPEMRGEEAVSYLKQQGLHSSLSEAMDAARYSINQTEQTTYQGSNPQQGYQSTFTSEEVIVTGRSGDQSDSWRWGMKLKGVGYGDRLLETEPGEITATDNRVEIRKQWSAVGGQRSVASDDASRITHHVSLIEWYENRPDGLEQGFTLLERPAITQGEQPLRVVMEMSGGLRAKADESGRSVRLSAEGGKALLLYDHLKAWDAEGRDLMSKMKVEGRELVLEVDDREATYPLTIDPLLSQEAKLTASDGGSGELFGTSVSISGDTAIVGAIFEDGVVVFSGAAYVFERSGGIWTEQQKLTASDGGVSDQFGASVSISGDTAIVGATFDDDAGSTSGSAYVFERSGGIWTQQQKLTANDAAAFDRFGESVSISGDTAIIAARGDDHDGGTDSGSAYVFERSGGIWTQQQKLTAIDAAASDFFGFSVSIDGDTAIIGASLDDDGGSASGSAYVFERSGGTWTEQAKLTAIDAAGGDNFGSSVSISGDRAIVGAPLDDDNGSSSGSAYVFERTGTTWAEEAKLTANDGAVDDLFGLSVSISGDTAIVGAFRDDDAGSQSGSAYVFERNGATWNEQVKLTASDAAAGDEFGTSVSIDGNTAIVGSPRDDDACSIANCNSGSAYIFAGEASDNTPPAIAAESVFIGQDSSLFSALIANVTDAEDALDSLTVTVDGGSNSTVNGVTVSNISINASGQVTADISAACGASNADFTLEVTDSGGLTSSDTLSGEVSPETTPPTINCPADITVGNDPGQCSAEVSFNVTASDNCDPSVTPVCKDEDGNTITSPHTFPIGTMTITCSATDVASNTGECSFTVTVNETEGPQITTILTHIQLSPPDHKYRTINVTDCVLSVSDNCDTGLSVSDVVIAQVTSDEPENSSDDGNTVDDIVIAADCKSVMLRAERKGGGNGRVYTIIFEVTDASGNVGTATCKVTVPLNQDSALAIDDGVAYEVVSSCASP